jgi:hypothetical protein
MKKVIIIAVSLLIIAGAVGFYQWNKPHKTVENEKGIEITAAQLYTEFVINEQAANQKYLNKAMQVTGKIVTIDENQDKQRFIVLQTEDPINGVMCTMHTGDWQATVGQTISVKGFCSGVVGDVKLTDCIIVKSSK